MRTESEARSYSSETEIRYKHLYNAFERMASRGAPFDEANVEEWEEDAAFYIVTFEGIKSIAWVDEGLRVRQIVPREDNLAYLDALANDIPWEPSELTLWMACNNGAEFNGYILGTIDIGEFISPILEEIENKYMLQLSIEGTSVFTSENWVSPKEDLIARRTISLQDTAVLNLSYAPTEELIKAEKVDARNALLYRVMFSLVAVVAVYFAQNYNAIALISEMRYRRLFERVPVGLYRTTADGGILDANPALLDMLGYPDLKTAQQTKTSDGYVNREEHTRWQELMNRDGSVHNFEAQWWRSDGTILWLSENSTAIMDNDKHVLHYEGSLEDITERKLAMEKLIAEEKMAGIGTLSAGIAHEMNSPLQVITGISDSLTRRITKEQFDEADFLKQLQMLSRNAWRIVAIIKSLLQYARPSDGNITSIDLNQVIQDTLLLTEHQLRTWSNISVVADLAPDLPDMTGDDNQITQVLINLLTNAKDAMPKGGEIGISTQYNPDEQVLILQVKDNGEGIPQENIKKIFDPFYTTKEVGKGTGLGLSLVHGIVRNNGGQIAVDSTPGNGTCFTIMFPISKSELA